MQIVDLAAEVRHETGRGISHRLRAAGRVPAILYGRGQGNTNLSVSRREVFRLIHGETTVNCVVRLNVAEPESTSVQEHISLFRDIQYDPETEKIIHIDFHRIALDEPVHADVPINFVGASVGVKLGGILEHILRTLAVECLPLEVPDSIEVDVSALDIGHSVHVKDLKLPENVRMKTSPDQTIATVASPTVSTETAATPVAGVAEAAAGESDDKKKPDDKKKSDDKKK